MQLPRIVPPITLLAALIYPTLSSPDATAQISAAAPAPAFAIDGRSFQTWQDYTSSSYFAENGKRCGKPATVIDYSRAPDPSDCTFSLTNPTSDYDTVDIYEIPIVVHIIQHTNGDGVISDAMVNSQMDVLNEDFLALAGTPGAPGYNVGIQFVLADTDPSGQPTTGITRDTNDTWFNDGGSYWNTLAWDTANYMNVYTNSASGNLGYVPDLPQGGIAGSNADRVVVLWSSFGRNAPIGPPFDQGRTLTHEVGHYLGLEHTFSGGCASGSPPGCYTSGDLICDTNSEQSSASGCPGGQTSCGSLDPIDNYMDYSDDTCMEVFTNEQSHRMRCSLLGYRADLYSIATPAVCGDNVRSGAEDCDGTDDDNCPSLCLIDCTCPAPVCGNNIIETGEDCDGSDPGACPTGSCGIGCACPAPVCGNDIIETGEDCDGSDPGACPTGSCGVGCACPAPVCGNDVTETGEDCDGSDDTACPGECQAGCTCPTNCGDGTCQASEGENDVTCSADCGCSFPGSCGGSAPAGCYCDTGCASFGDCCADSCSACTINCVSTCGNDIIEAGEECDGTDPGSCPTGVCDPDCTCEDPACGNDIIEAGEECDGTDPGSCPTGVCDPDCTCEDPVCGNAIIEAGEDCEVGDDSACPGQCQVDCSCPICGTAPELDGACNLADASGAGKSSIQIKDKNSNTKDQLRWKWNKGTAIAVADFMSPDTGTGTYRLCLYDAGGLLAELDLPAGGTVATCDGKACWKPSGTKGFKYKNKTGSGSDGIVSAKLKAGAAGKSQIQIKIAGKDGFFDAPPTPGLTEPVVMQLLIDDVGPVECFKTSFTSFTKKDAENYKAKGP
jgi:hypothetical protein